MSENKYTDNMSIYNRVREVPQDAMKPIEAGRLKGFTDINPMWRIKKLTEVFGIYGFGWYIKKVAGKTYSCPDGQVVYSVDIELYVKINDEWSMPIFGTGGSKLIAMESKSLRVDDDAMKKAYTDAISVACKGLGVAADVYYAKDMSKYSALSSFADIEAPAFPNGTIQPLNTKEAVADAINKITQDNSQTAALPTAQNAEKQAFIPDDSPLMISVEEAQQYVLPFGKFKGKTIGEVLVAEPQYVKWLANAFKPEDADGDYARRICRLIAQAAQ